MKRFKYHFVLAPAFLISMAILLSACDSTPDDIDLNSTDNETDPVVVNFPIAYIERPLARDEDDGALLADNILEPAAFNPGAKLIIKTRAAVSAPRTVITDTAFVPLDAPAGTLTEPYDVKDIAVSPDAEKIVFAMRAPEIEDADEDEQPKWDLWQYEMETGILSQLTIAEFSTEDGNDVAPAFLPDGRIVFSSDLQKRSRAILLDEGTSAEQFSAGTERDRDTPAFNLHVLDPDSGQIEQITFNQSHDLDPIVLDNGRILFLRWDNYGGSKNRLSLYTTKPDGTDTSLLYGYDSQDTGTGGEEAAFTKPQEMPDGRIIAALRGRESINLGGDLIAINTEDFVDIQRPLTNSSAIGPAQTSLFPNFTFSSSDETESLSGHISSGYPLYDNTDRVLVSWSTCAVDGVTLDIYVNDPDPDVNDEPRQLIGSAGQFVDREGNDVTTPVIADPTEISSFPCNESVLAIPGIVQSAPRFGLWMFDPADETQSPVVLAESEKMFTEGVVIEPRALPDFIEPVDAAATANIDLINEKVGVLNIRSVYDMDGTLQDPADQRARFIRIIKAVSEPNEDVIENDFFGIAVGRAGNQRLKFILGYVPIEPDGSAMFKVPADVAFTLSLVDENGERVSDRHENWLSVRAGEQRNCRGCHDPASNLPHGRAEAEPPSANPGALAQAPFPGTMLMIPADDPLDDPTPAPVPGFGETMAEYYARTFAPRTPSMDLIYDDEWTEAGGTPRESIAIRYADLDEGDTYIAPKPTTCLDDWNSGCRSIIAYPTHIQPIWNKSRPVNTIMGVQDYACVNCHLEQAGVLPAGVNQIDLTGMEIPGEDFYESYTDLLDGDTILVVDPDDNTRLVPEFEIRCLTVIIDTEGVSVPGPLASCNNISDIIPTGDINDISDIVGSFMFDLDENGMQQPVRVPTDNATNSVISTNGAAASTIFFDVFENATATDHTSLLSEAELRLIREWIDLGGQYYNNPFDAVPEE